MQYEIIGGSFPVVVCHMQPGEQMKTEGGSMVWMDPVFDMKTSGGGLGKVVSRAFSGESLFQNTYTASAAGKIAFGSSFPGKIIPIEVGPGKEFILQKKSFLASTMGVDLAIHFNQKLGAGLVGGEGFIMQRLSGQGVAFAECDGDIVEYTLNPGQQLIVDTGNVLGFSSTVQMNVQRIKGGMNMVFGGEGLFNTVLTGPGTVWIQTMCVASLANVLRPYLPTGNN